MRPRELPRPAQAERRSLHRGSGYGLAQVLVLHDPDAPRGLLFPGDCGIGKGIAQPHNAWMPRLGFAWDPSGRGVWAIRAGYGLSYDQFQNGSGTASQGPVSSLPWAQFNQYSGAGLNFESPYTGQLVPVQVQGARQRRRCAGQQTG